MPTFVGVEMTVTADVDFEIFCARCGAGICLNGDTRKSRGRNMPQVTIEPCSACIEAAQDETEDEIRSELRAEIESLRDELTAAKAHLNP